MTDLWYYTCEGKQMDPVSATELRRLANEGLLRPSDMVWTEGMARWAPAGSTPEIFPGALPEPEPVPIPLVALAPAASTATETIPIKPLPLPDAPADKARPEPVLPVKKTPRDWVAESVDPPPRRRRRAAPAEDDDRPRRRFLTQRSTPLGLLIALGTAGSILSVALVIAAVVFLFGRNRTVPPQPPGAVGMDAAPDLHIPDIDLYIKDKNGNVLAEDKRDDPACVIDWMPPATGEYQVHVVYPDVHEQNHNRPLVKVRVTVNIREKRTGRVLKNYTLPLALKDSNTTLMTFQAGTVYQITARTELVDREAAPPLPAPDAPPGVSSLDGNLDFGTLAPGKEYVFKLQVPAHTRAEIRALGHRPSPMTNLDLIVHRERDNFLAAKEDGPATATATVVLDAATTSEIYRVRVVNAGPVPARGTVFFTKTAKQ